MSNTATQIAADFPRTPDSMVLADLLTYNKILVMMSGGKDSVACLLHLLDLGVPKDLIELWHHDIDGAEGSELMDWPVTRAYCKKLAEAFDLPLYFSWKEGGFEGEMLRENALTRPNRFEKPDGTIGSAGGTRGKKNTRLKFPQVTANLMTRWCSAYLKIDVCVAALNNQERFRGIKTLVVTGERAEESSARAKYKVLEPHKADRRNGKRVKRYIDAWRPVHKWTEQDVWGIFEAFKVNPHPCYRVGFSRCSCMPCIFGNADQWATVKQLDPERFTKLAEYEELFGVTLKRKVSLPVLAEKGTAYTMNPEEVKIAMSREYDEPIFLKEWKLPSGAFGESCGPV